MSKKQQSAPPAKSWKSSQMKPNVQEETDSRMDRPAMKSVSQKRDMFEQQGIPEVELPDPVLMSMSQRKAMFEKNMSVSTPIARFGKSVTPAKPQVNLGLVELEDMNCEVGNKLAVTEFPIMKAPMDLISETIDNLLTSVVVECNPKSSYKKPKIHYCNKCGKTFAQYKSSQKHKQSCSGLDKLLKVVTCSICKKGFSDKRSLQRHVKAIHAEKPAKVSYNCAECDISFCSKQKMQLHNSAKHGILLLYLIFVVMLIKAAL